MKSVLKENLEAMKIPSICKATDGAAIAFWLVSSPTPRIEIIVLYPSFLATVTPGAIALKPTKSTIFFLSISSLLKAVTALETSCKLSTLFSAVTITSSIASSLEKTLRLIEVIESAREVERKDLKREFDNFIKNPCLATKKIFYR